AVIIHSPRPRDPRIELLNSLGLPFLVHGRSETEHVHAWLDIDNENAVNQERQAQAVQQFDPRVPGARRV
ncbi:hypothetical protein ACC713_36990, partial [Rhizobium johnstonii]